MSLEGFAFDEGQQFDGRVETQHVSRAAEWFDAGKLPEVLRDQESAVRALARVHITGARAAGVCVATTTDPPLIHATAQENEQLFGADFRDALEDLEQAPDEARAEGHAPPAERAMQSARLLLRRMYGIRQCRYEVYPTRDREMCIYIRRAIARSW